MHGSHLQNKKQYGGVEDSGDVVIEEISGDEED
jgi:hypothetical protein